MQIHTNCMQNNGTKNAEIFNLGEGVRETYVKSYWGVVKYPKPLLATLLSMFDSKMLNTE